MTRRALSLAAVIAGLTIPTLAHAEACADLAGLKAAGVKVTAATAVTPAPTWKPETRSFYSGEMRTPFCRVEGLIEGDIGFEIWLPPKTQWTGRFMGAGVGGDAGVFNYSDMARVVPMGFAAGTTDSGHKVADATWMMSPRKAENYAHRAEHLMTVAGKAIVAAYYGRPTQHAYFLGCSGGGRQALKELQVYPDDYDGIIAGAPGPDMPMLSARHLWTALYQQRNPAGALSDPDWNLIVSAVTAQCDKLDGVADGVVEDPRACHFDAGKIRCAPGVTTACLSDAKLTTLATIQAPLRDETGKAVDQGLFPGVRTRPGPPPPLLQQTFGQGVHHDPNWDANTFSIVGDVGAVYRTMPQLAAKDPNIAAFAKRGGKLILYNGWADPSVIAQQVLAYYADVQKTLGPARAAQFTRLYMAPGMFHCGGGPGADAFGGSGRPAPTPDPDHDLLSALVGWVETGKAPDRIIASKIVDGRVVRTHPLCVFPKVAVYNGQGSTDDAASFTCRK